MIKNFVSSDVHSYFYQWMEALQENGFDICNPQHRIIVCGDLFDRGPTSEECFEFVKNLSMKGRLVYIKGNHESLLKDAVRELNTGSTSLSYHHVTNGTLQTIADITDIDECALMTGSYRDRDFKKIYKVLDFIDENSVDYFEADDYIFVHGWIPCITEDMPMHYRKGRTYQYMSDWRKGTRQDWEQARWFNGMELAHFHNVTEPGKIIVCGHWHTSYAWSQIEKTCEEFGPGAKFDIYKNTDDGIIALDACTALTNKVNCFVVETSC